MKATTHAKSNLIHGLSRASRPRRLNCPSRALIACLVGLTLATVACSEEKPRPRGLLDAEGNAIPDAPAKQGAAPAAGQGEVVPGALPSPFAEGEEPSEATVAAAAPAVEKKEERDLEGELRTLVGQPTSCLDLEKVASGGGRVSIRVTASVLPSGSISRASVTASGQPAEALRCIERQLAAASFKGPVEGAPLSVSAESVVEAVKAAQPAAPAPKPVEVQRAATTLAQPADGVELAAPADDSELAQPPDEDEPAELAQPAD